MRRHGRSMAFLNASRKVDCCISEHPASLFDVFDDCLVSIFDVLSIEICHWLNESAFRVDRTDDFTVLAYDTIR